MKANEMSRAYSMNANMTNTYKNLGGKPEEKRPLARPRRR
jgi:hypothetical protein